MVRTVFGCGEREEAAAALCPPDYLARRYPVWRMGAGRGLATFLLASPLATLAPIQLGRTRILDIGVVPVFRPKSYHPQNPNVLICCVSAIGINYGSLLKISIIFISQISKYLVY